MMLVLVQPRNTWAHIELMRGFKMSLWGVYGVYGL